MERGREARIFASNFQVHTSLTRLRNTISASANFSAPTRQPSQDGSSLLMGKYKASTIWDGCSLSSPNLLSASPISRDSVPARFTREIALAHASHDAFAPRTLTFTRKTIKKWAWLRGRDANRCNYWNSVGCLTFNWSIHGWVFVYSTANYWFQSIYAGVRPLSKAGLRIIASNWNFMHRGLSKSHNFQIADRNKFISVPLWSRNVCRLYRVSCDMWNSF